MLTNNVVAISIIASLLVLHVPAMAERVLIFGGTRNTGLETVRLLLEQGDSVAAFVRDSSDVGALNELNVPLIFGDALAVDTVDSAFAVEEFDSVVSTLSGSIRNHAVDSQGNINVFAAAERASVKRLVLVTVIGASGTEGVLEEKARQFLKPVIDAKTVAESDLRKRNLNWTILRPGQLAKGAATGNGVLTEDQTVMGRITMGELAALVIECLGDKRTIGKIFHVVDREMIGSFSFFD